MREPGIMIPGHPTDTQFIKLAMKRLFLIGLCLSTSSAFAASQILLETPVTYAPDAGVVQRVKDECHIEDMLTRHVGDVLRKINRGGDGTVASQADAGDAKVLRLQITHVLGVGGGAWSGPKATTVTADLIEGGKVTRHTKINRWSVGGVWGAFKGTCSILERTTVVIGRDLGRWARNPSYEIKEEAPPQVADEPGAGKDFCTPGESMPNASGSSLTLCVKKGHFAHDQYEVKVDGAVVVKGIDDETTGGVNGSYGGRPVNLTCAPVLSAPEEVTESQIESMRSMDPQATREQLKQRYLSLNTVETARHCVVRVDSKNVLSTDIHFE
ncbi:hypothetical protein [Burkholderia ubonensis]|uniref:hypothetical protein n=2 Tax=Burkholderia cepacia complex TaxID=87882 RepID=UPI001E3A338A|nr:hypothetical protein [Burkholderia ubonensis]